MKVNEGLPTEDTTEDTETGLPGLGTWWRVYVFVVSVFCVWLTALALLPTFFP